MDDDDVVLAADLIGDMRIVAHVCIDLVFSDFKLRCTLEAVVETFCQREK